MDNRDLHLHVARRDLIDPGAIGTTVIRPQLDVCLVTITTDRDLHLERLRIGAFDGIPCTLVGPAGYELPQEWKYRTNLDPHDEGVYRALLVRSGLRYHDGYFQVPCAMDIIITLRNVGPTPKHASVRLHAPPRD